MTRRNISIVLFVLALFLSQLACNMSEWTRKDTQRMAESIVNTSADVILNVSETIADEACTHTTCDHTWDKALQPAKDAVHQLNQP